MTDIPQVWAMNQHYLASKLAYCNAVLTFLADDRNAAHIPAMVRSTMSARYNKPDYYAVDAAFVYIRHGEKRDFNNVTNLYNTGNSFVSGRRQIFYPVEEIYCGSMYFTDTPQTAELCAMKSACDAELKAIKNSVMTWDAEHIAAAREYTKTHSAITNTTTIDDNLYACFFLEIQPATFPVIRAAVQRSILPYDKGVSPYRDVLLRRIDAAAKLWHVDTLQGYFYEKQRSGTTLASDTL